MDTINRNVILYIATSLDGYIATVDDDISFLSVVEKQGEDYGYSEFMSTVDTVILGRKTFDKLLLMGVEKPYEGKTVYVISRYSSGNRDNIHYFNGELKGLISKLKSTNGLNIFCDGGASIVNLLQNEDLIDEYIISIIPILLGNGIRLFKDGRSEQRLKLLSARTFNTGLLQIHYKRK